MIVMKLYFKLRFVAFVAISLVLCSQNPSAWAKKSYSSKDLYFIAQKSYYKFKESPENQKFRHNWEKVIQKFSNVLEKYPQSPQAYKAVFTMARLYEGLNAISKNRKDLDQALYYYKRVAQDFSPGSLTDDALFASAEIYRDKSNISSASGIYKSIFEKFPNGDQASKAKLQYAKLASLLPVQKPKSSIQKSSKQTIPEILKELEALSKDIKAEDARHTKLVKPVHRVKPVIKAVKPVPVKKAIVVAKPKVFPKAPIKKPIFSKRKGGHLYMPPSGKVGSSAPLIVVDAGHGGKDQGAKSAKGIHEKDVNLIIAKHVKTILVNRFKYPVVMTRNNDTFIPLKERSEIANKRNAGLFVSIHANAAERKAAHGVETYFLGTSNNDRALATAARENGELVKSVKDDQVQEILASLITTTKINDSSRLAGTVQENLFQSSRKKYRGLKNLGVKEGPFYVLHGADMPSILVEVGFLTNRKEASMLSKPDYLYRLASSIAEGIHKYLQDKGPSI